MTGERRPLLLVVIEAALEGARDCEESAKRHFRRLAAPSIPGSHHHLHRPDSLGLPEDILTIGRLRE